MNIQPIIKPRSLKKGDAIGVFTPSWTGHIFLKDKYQHSFENLKLCINHFSAVIFSKILLK